MIATGIGGVVEPNTILLPSYTCAKPPSANATGFSGNLILTYNALGRDPERCATLAIARRQRSRKYGVGDRPKIYAKQFCMRDGLSSKVSKSGHTRLISMKTMSASTPRGDASTSVNGRLPSFMGALALFSWSMISKIAETTCSRSRGPVNVPRFSTMRVTWNRRKKKDR